MALITGNAFTTEEVDARNEVLDDVNSVVTH